MGPWRWYCHTGYTFLSDLRRKVKHILLLCCTCWVHSSLYLALSYKLPSWIVTPMEVKDNECCLDISPCYTEHMSVNKVYIQSVFKKQENFEKLTPAAYFNLIICPVATSCLSYPQNFKLYAICILYYTYYVPDWYWCLRSISHSNTIYLQGWTRHALLTKKQNMNKA